MAKARINFEAFVLLVASLFLSNIGIAGDADVLEIKNAWVREAPPGASVNAGYMTLQNKGVKTLSIQSVQSSAFEKVEIHEMAMVDGMMEMRELEALPIAKGEQIIFEPGGKHLMLKNPKSRLKDGDVVDIILTFSDGRQQVLTVKVKKDI